MLSTIRLPRLNRHCALGLLLLLLFPRDSLATCNPTCALWKFWVGAGAGFGFNGNVPSEWQTAFNTAANQWNNAHSAYGQPTYYLGGGDTYLEIIVETPVSNSAAVAEWDPVASKIRINPNYVSLSTNEKLATAMHEFGHQLGFDDNYQCYGWSGSVMGAIGPDSAYDLTDNDYCGMNYYYDPSCEAGGGADYYNHCTPLVMSFSTRLPRLSAPVVQFDIAGNGDLPTCAWLDQQFDGLLVLDRNRDGTINSGQELFGNATPMPFGAADARAWNGFQALGVFDRTDNGGNNNGIIDPGDGVYQHLRVWFDQNRDAVSQSDELVPLIDLGVTYIQLNALSLKIVDPHGNVLWFRSNFGYRTPGGRLQQGNVTDVIFKVK
jgi:hypothetical protein